MRLDIVFFDAGGGHRAAANALKLSIGEQYPAWNVRLVNLQDELDKLDVIQRFTGIRMQDVYNHLLRNGWTLGSEYMIPPMHWLIRMNHSKVVRALTEYWSKDAPDLLVSVIPNFNRQLYAGYRAARPDGRMVTILTDMADYPPHFWIEPRDVQEQWFIGGTERAVAQALELGHSRDRVFAASGMILHPRFYETPSVDAASVRQSLGLDVARKTGIVLFGGYGSTKMLDIARRVAEAKLDLQFIFICGKNEDLRRKLTDARLPFPHFIEGFTSEVPRYMLASDFLIGKPGPGSISEALQMRLPVIVEKNAWTLPQERFNADWVVEKGVGISLASFDGIADALRRADFDRMRANISRLNNRAVFEIPGMLEKIAACESAPV